MEKSYRLLRINKEEMTLTVMLKYGDKELQQDVVVENFTDLKMINEEIGKHLDKLQEDMDVINEKKDIEINPDLLALLPEEETIG